MIWFKLELFECGSFNTYEINVLELCIIQRVLFGLCVRIFLTSSRLIVVPAHSKDVFMPSGMKMYE